MTERLLANMSNVTSQNVLETRTLAELLSSRQNATVVVEAFLSVILNIAALFLNWVLCWSSSTNDKCLYPRTRSYRSPHGWAGDAVCVMSAFTESGGTLAPLVNFKHSVASC